MLLSIWTLLRVEMFMNHNLGHEHPEIIEHEIKIRVIDERFNDIEDLINKVNNKINRLIQYVICSLIMPIILHFYKII